jgi:plasmid stabilization system protein ParE
VRGVVWSETAIAQYDDAIDYLAERNEPAAMQLADRIEDAVNALARRPAGRPGQAEGTFEKIVQKTPYLLVFDLVGDELRVLRLFHMSQDWQNWNDEEEAP